MIMESGPFVPPPTQISLGMLKANPPVLSIRAPEYQRRTRMFGSTGLDRL
jgi:hypothetical protein